MIENSQLAYDIILYGLHVSSFFLASSSLPYTDRSGPIQLLCLKICLLILFTQEISVIINRPKFKLIQCIYTVSYTHLTLPTILRV